MKSKLTIDAELVGAQFDFYEDDTSKFLHLSAGYGFGKTTALCYKIIKLTMLNRNIDGGLVAPSFTDYKRDVLPALESILDKHELPYKYHGTDHTFNFPWTTGTLYVATGEKKLRGPNWGFAGINEVTLLPIERYREVIGRVRVKGAKYPQIVSSGTPEGIASEYYSIFVEKPWKGSRILYGDTRENSHNLDPSYIESLMNSYPKQMIDAYLKGLWVNLTGNRFYYSYDPLKNDKQNSVDESVGFICAMDMNVDPFCISIWQKIGRKFIGIDEIVLSGGEGYKVENIISAMATRGYTKNNTIICPDPTAKNRNVTGKTVKEILENHGFSVHMKASAPRFRERQINMNNHFDKCLIEVNPITQPKTKKDFMAVEVDPITFEKSKKNAELTHLSDGVDYMVDVYAPFNDHRSKNEVHKIR